MVCLYFQPLQPNSIVKNQSLKTNITPQTVSAMTLGAQSDPNEYSRWYTSDNGTN